VLPPGRERVERRVALVVEDEAGAVVGLDRDAEMVDDRGPAGDGDGDGNLVDDDPQRRVGVFGEREQAQRRGGFGQADVNGLGDVPQPQGWRELVAFGAEGAAVGGDGVDGVLGGFDADDGELRGVGVVSGRGG
jgi:hypothetical protein